MIKNVISIEGMIADYGEDSTQALLSTFSCERDGEQKNQEVETFVRKMQSIFIKGNWR